MKQDPNFLWVNKDNPEQTYGDGKARSKSYTSLPTNLTNINKMAISNWTSPETFCTITGMVTPDIYIDSLSEYNQTGIEPLVTNKDNQYAGTDSTTLTLRLAETAEYAEGIITLEITGINAEYLTKKINQRISKIPW